MKYIFCIIVFIGLKNCNNTSHISLLKHNQNKIIAFQPLGDYNENELTTLKEDIDTLFHLRIIVLKPIELTIRFKQCGWIEQIDSYSSDSLLISLSKMTNDSIIEVIGFTHKSIYVMKKLTFKNNNNDTTITYPDNVFGYGYITGNSCVISDIRLMSKDKTLLLNRLKKVTLHEMGHNFGLEHCSDTNCIMSETNGNIVNLNRMGGDYCAKCRKKLK